MKPTSKILVLMLGLMLPYMGFALYRAFAYPQHPFPNWFLYVAPCYFFGSITLLVVLRKKIVGGAPQQDSAAGTEVDRRRLKLLWIGVGTYSLIFLNGLRLGFTYANSMPLPVLVFGELLNGAILATFIFELRKVQKSIRQRETDARPTKVSTPD